MYNVTWENKTKNEQIRDSVKDTLPLENLERIGWDNKNMLWG